MGSRKRARAEFEARDETPGNFTGVASTLALLRYERNDGEAATPSAAAGDANDVKGAEWELTGSREKKKKKMRGNYPEIYHSPTSRLQSMVKTSDLQSLALYLIADGNSPQWVGVRHHNSVRKVVILMVPGLEIGMFKGSINLSGLDTKDAGGIGIDTTALKIESSSSATSGSGKYTSPDDYYPFALSSEKLSVPLKPLAECFTHAWPIKGPGDDKFHRVHSSMQALLKAPLPKSKDDKKNSKGPKAPREGSQWQNKRTSIVEYISSINDLQENDYVIHPALLPSEEAKENVMSDRRHTGRGHENGWVDTKIASIDDGDVPDSEIEQGSITGGRTIYALDCEMCMTSDTKFELTRISVVTWDGSVVMDELVKPTNPITDYLTPYSGMTKELLDPVTTTLKDIQTRLLNLLTPRSILVGHSLNSDLDALQLTHPFIIDTSIIYPHPRGAPLKSSLKWLTQKYLTREIQKGHGASGHDSIEDARACLDLVKQKCEKGPKWGTSEASIESIFQRLSRTPRPGTSGGADEGQTRKGAVVDWGDPKRGLGGDADLCISCASDAEVVGGIEKALSRDPDAEPGLRDGVDLVWARFREIEAARGWWSKASASDNEEQRLAAIGRYAVTSTATAELQSKEPTSTATEDANTPTDAEPTFSDVPLPPTKATLSAVVASTIKHIAALHASLPPCTALIIYSGSGDCREVYRLQAKHRQYKREYATKKWDELSVKWDDGDEQALRQACSKAREGVGFLGVK